jgi:hypothetical protein
MESCAGVAMKPGDAFSVPIHFANPVIQGVVSGRRIRRSAVMRDAQIWNSATRFVQVFEDKAVMAAGMCEEIALAQGDPQLCRFWEQITAAVIELQRRNAIN